MDIMKKRKTIRLLAVALTLAMTVSLLAVPASAAGANAASAQTTKTTQRESGTGLNVKAAMGALGMGAIVYFYWNPAAWQKASSAAQFVLSDAASDAMLLLGDVAAEAKLTLIGAASGAKEEWNRRKEQSAAKETEDETPAAQVIETGDSETLKTETQGSATQTAATSSEADTDEAAQVIVKLSGTSAAKADN
jgi:hypothetical protein